MTNNYILDAANQIYESLTTKVKSTEEAFAILQIVNSMLALDAQKELAEKGYGHGV